MLHRLDRDEFMPPVDFALICICCALREYRLAHLINSQLRFELERVDDVNHREGTDDLPVYARYVWDDSLAHRSAVLYGNRPLTRTEVIRPGDLFGSEETLLLLPELAKADYLLQLQGDFSATETEELRDALQDLPGVTMAFITDPTKVRNIEPLLI